MSQVSHRSDRSCTLCVVGMAYFEVFLPQRGLDVSLGEEVFVDGIGAGLGGALNPASVACALGVDTTLAHPRGDGPTDAAVAAACEDLDLSTRTWGAGDDPAISLVHSRDGDRAFTSSAELDALGDCPPLGGFDWVHVPGLEEAHRLQKPLARAQQAGATVSVSGSWAPRHLEALLDAGADRWDLLILNGDEARRATGDANGPLAKLIDPLQAAAVDIAITDGPNAIYALFDGQRVRVDTADADHFVDATGAGDAFAAGVIAARLGDAGPKQALEFGAGTAGVVVGMRGGVVRDASVFSSLLPASRWEI